MPPLRPRPVLLNFGRSFYVSYRRLHNTPKNAYLDPFSIHASLHVPAHRQSDLTHYGLVPARQITFSDLIRFGKPPLSPKLLLESAEYTRQELPHRLARRVKAHQGLPFIVGTNPYLDRIHNLYQTSFETLAAVPPIETIEDNRRYVEMLGKLVEEHNHNIPALAQGFSESKRYMSDAAITSFLDRAIRNRISIRLIAEQHISLTLLSTAPSSQSMVPDVSSSGPERIGIIDTKCSPRRMAELCAGYVSEMCEGTYGRTPKLIVDGEIDSSFIYVPVHLEYILTELLKNSFRATVEHHNTLMSSFLPPVVVTVAHCAKNAVTSLRIRDQGGGISSRHLQDVFSYAYTSVRSDSEDQDYSRTGSAPPHNTYGGPPPLFGEITQAGMQTGLGTIAGLGYGLPLSRLYAEYFGGGLELVTMYGHGTDVFITLRSVCDE